KFLTKCARPCDDTAAAGPCPAVLPQREWIRPPGSNVATTSCTLILSGDLIAIQGQDAEMMALEL
ncbi:MAG: hypothetical protein N2C12_06810, partial [Planctomycetales bacterium]